MAPADHATALRAGLPPTARPAVRRPASPRPDGELAAAAAAGEEAALAELFDRHWGAAYRVALLIVHDHAAAEDVAQEAFIAAVRRLDRFDRRRPFGPWVTRIAANRAIDAARARRVREAAAERAARDPHGRAASAPAPALADAELQAALASLPVEQRAVVVLRHLLELTPGEIARTLGLPRGTVNSRLRRGLDALAATLAQERA